MSEEFSYTHPNLRWSDEKRRKMSELNRKRLGAPEGHCIIWGVYAPIEHREPLRYWSTWFKHNHGLETAKEFLVNERDSGWAHIDRIWELYEHAMEAGLTKKVLQALNREVAHANQNRR